MKTYAFWNNKGGTGKTSLIFQTILAYAKKYPDKRILALDLCPQANLSELMLGGLVGSGSKELLILHKKTPRASIGGYFELRFRFPYARPSSLEQDKFIIKPCNYNRYIEKNVSLCSGDPILELQVNAISTMANTQIPGSDPWLSVIDWLRDFMEPINNQFDVAFIDCNPSFSIYTQIALSVTNFLIVPVMADDSSRRALENAFSLIYNFQLPSETYSKYSFSDRLQNAERNLPKVHTILKNRLTQYMVTASAYSAVLKTIDERVGNLIKLHPEYFNFKTTKKGMVEMRDFQTAGVVSFANGQSFYDLIAGRHRISNRVVQVKEEYRQKILKHMDRFIDRF